MRTCGKKIRQGEKSRSLCDYCGTRWDRRSLYRDAAGLLVCPQEGRGRDAVTLARANAADAKAVAARRSPATHDPGRYDKETAEPIG